MRKPPATLMVFVTACSYMVRHDDPQVKDLFGTDTLPSAFGAGMPKEAVFAALRTLNPDAIILWRDAAGKVTDCGV